jgi:hypothetical protein
MSIKEELEMINLIQKVEKLAGILPNRPDYHYDGKKLKWGEDIPLEIFESMLINSEMVMLMDAEGNDYCTLIRDGYGKLRQKKVNK